MSQDYLCRLCGAKWPYLRVCRVCKVELCDPCMHEHLLGEHAAVVCNHILNHLSDVRDAGSLNADAADYELHKRQGV